MKAIDLFAGAGGFSTGAAAVGCSSVWASNHWPLAVQYHATNYPTVQHACQDLQQQDWREVLAHDLLLASPACQGHSSARGKERPHHNTLQSTAWDVVSTAKCRQQLMTELFHFCQPLLKNSYIHAKLRCTTRNSFRGQNCMDDFFTMQMPLLVEFTPHVQEVGDLSLNKDNFLQSVSCQVFSKKGLKRHLKGL